MKAQSKTKRRRFQLKLLAYGNSYYIERIAELEALLARNPRAIQIDLVGVGEIPADMALLIRSILLARSPRTQLTTNARSSLQGGSVLVWLTGDHRLMRSDARVFLRRAEASGSEDKSENEVWPVAKPKYADSFSEIDPEEADYVRVLEVINEFLPVKELICRPIGVPLLRQFGLVENEKLDHFLATAFGMVQASTANTANESKKKRVRAKSQAGTSMQPDKND
jgi:hypothetical protein